MAPDDLTDWLTGRQPILSVDDAAEVIAAVAKLDETTLAVDAAFRASELVLIAEGTRLGIASRILAARDRARPSSVSITQARDAVAAVRHALARATADHPNSPPPALPESWLRTVREWEFDQTVFTPAFSGGRGREAGRPEVEGPVYAELFRFFTDCFGRELIAGATLHDFLNRFFGKVGAELSEVEKEVSRRRGRKSTWTAPSAEALRKRVARMKIGEGDDRL